MEPRPDRWQGLRTRAAAALPLAVGAFACIYVGGVIFNLLVMMIGVLMLKEWEHMSAGERPATRFAVAAALLVPCACIVWLRAQPAGFNLALSLALVVAATDIAAYFTGRRYGRRKLAPHISPGKTWEGLGGGVAAAALCALLLFPSALPLSHAPAFMLGVMLALLAQAGDLGESFFKRRAGLKDSGNLIPGHGGVLDRLDGYLLTAPALALVAWCVA